MQARHVRHASRRAERGVSVYWTATFPNQKHMLLTIRTTHGPATDLGFLLHKHPDHVHTREFPFGNATVVVIEGSHRQLKHPNKAGRVTVAGHPSLDVPRGTLNNILKQAGQR